MGKQIVEMTVASVKMELPDTKTVRLQWPDGYDPEFKTGQFITVHFPEVPTYKRAYSLSSCALDRGHYDHIRQEMLDKLKDTVGEEILNKSLAQVELSVRARKALQLLGIQTIGDLAARTEAELMGVKNFGQTSLDELKALLTQHGLSLRQLD